MPRTLEPTVRCNFCHKILINATWMVERREYHVRYRSCTCPACEVYLFAQTRAAAATMPARQPAV